MTGSCEHGSECEITGFRCVTSEKSEGHNNEISGSIKHGFCRNKLLLTSSEFPVPTVHRSKQVSHRLLFYVALCTVG